MKDKATLWLASSMRQSILRISLAASTLREPPLPDLVFVCPSPRPLYSTQHLVGRSLGLHNLTYEGRHRQLKILPN